MSSKFTKGQAALRRIREEVERANKCVLSRFTKVNDDDMGTTYVANLTRGYGWVIVEFPIGSNVSVNSDFCGVFGDRWCEIAGDYVPEPFDGDIKGLQYRVSVTIR